MTMRMLPRIILCIQGSLHDDMSSNLVENTNSPFSPSRLIFFDLNFHLKIFPSKIGFPQFGRFNESRTTSVLPSGQGFRVIILLFEVFVFCFFFFFLIFLTSKCQNTTSNFIKVKSKELGI